jgi:uncharacterized protein (DUF3820 family)
MPDDRFSAACDVVMPFGKHQGRTLARIGATDDGLRYLDWLRGEGIRSAALSAAVETYLGHPAVARQLDAAIGD